MLVLNKKMSKNVLVTGCSSGIGYAIASKFLNEGYNVYGCDIHKPQSQLEEKLSFYQCDIGVKEQVKKIYNYLVEKKIILDAIVNNAGVNLNGSIEDISYEDWDRIIKTNIYGPFNVTRFMQKLIGDKGGAIVNIGSEQSFIAKKNRVAYCTSKGAVMQFTRSLAVDLAYRGIRVNCVCPGPVDTPMTQEMTKGRTLELNQPVSRLGRPEEIADVVYFLCTESAGYITGTSVVVDGGYTAI